MPYKTNNDLPKKITKHLPDHAQDIYREAYNHALDEYRNKEKRRNPNEPLEVICHKVAWGAVKKKYEKHDDGNWHPILNIEK
jgi:cation transport regulator